MNVKPLFAVSIFLCHAVCVSSSAPFAPDTSKKKPDKTGVARTVKTDGQEIMLGEIEIRGEVEKPSVIIVPKRVEPELEEKELNRSFEREVKESAGEIPKQDESLRKVEPAPSIKKTIEKKRN